MAVFRKKASLFQTFQIFKCPEIVFLTIALLFGISFCLIIPTGAGNDETKHVARVWEISTFHFIPNELLSKGTYFPDIFNKLSYRNPYFFDPVGWTFFQKYLNVPVDPNDGVLQTTSAVYSPLLYIIQGAVFTIFRKLSISALVTYYTARLTEILGYTLLVFFAIRLIPVGKWIVTYLALAPMAIYQTGTIGADPYTNGIGFLYLGWMLYLILNEKPITMRAAWITIGMNALLFSAKVNALSLLPLMLFLPPRKYASKKIFAFVIASSTVLFLVLFVAWNIIAYSPDVIANSSGGVNAVSQLKFILADPVRFLGIFFNDILIHGKSYFLEWIGVFAYDQWSVPAAVYPIYIIGLIVTWFFDRTAIRISARRRLLWIGIFFLGYALTVVQLYLASTGVGNPVIYGVLGRYFTFIAPLLILGLILPERIGGFKLSAGIPAAVGTLASLGVFIWAAFMVYHVACGVNYYIPGLCYQPPYKNWDPNAQFTAPLTAGTTLQQTFTPVCSPVKTIRVWTAPAQSASDQTTTLTVKDKLSGLILETQTVNNGDAIHETPAFVGQSANGKGWLEFSTTSVFDQVKGKELALKITSTGTDPAQGLSFSITTRHEYAAGEFSINDLGAGSDLLFEYTCSVP